jgi:hypothetical protein
VNHFSLAFGHAEWFPVLVEAGGRLMAVHSRTEISKTNSKEWRPHRIYAIIWRYFIFSIIYVVVRLRFHFREVCLATQTLPGKNRSFFLRVLMRARYPSSHPTFYGKSL